MAQRSVLSQVELERVKRATAGMASRQELDQALEVRVDLRIHDYIFVIRVAVDRA